MENKCLNCNELLDLEVGRSYTTRSGKVVSRIECNKCGMSSVSASEVEFTPNDKSSEKSS